MSSQSQSALEVFVDFAAVVVVVVGGSAGAGLPTQLFSVWLQRFGQGWVRMLVLLLLPLVLVQMLM